MALFGQPTRFVPLFSIAFSLIAFASPPPAQAATDGNLGNVSVGTSQISIIVGDTAQATGFSDIILAPWSSGSPAPVGTSTACIYTSTGGYQVTATSANAAGSQFRLAGTSGFVRYFVRWNDGSSGLTPVTNGTPLAGLVGDATSPTCNGANPATVEVRITNSAISSAGFGQYSDTLTLMITPQ